MIIQFNLDKVKLLGLYRFTLPIHISNTDNEDLGILQAIIDTGCDYSVIFEPALMKFQELKHQFIIPKIPLRIFNYEFELKYLTNLKINLMNSNEKFLTYSNCKDLVYGGILQMDK